MIKLYPRAVVLSKPYDYQGYSQICENLSKLLTEDGIPHRILTSVAGFKCFEFSLEEDRNFFILTNPNRVEIFNGY